MWFSQRIGKTDVRSALQIEAMDKALENKLWNNIVTDFLGEISQYKGRDERESSFEKTLRFIWTEFFENRVDEIPIYSTGEINSDAVCRHLKSWYFEVPWFKKYDLAEFILILDQQLETGFPAICNQTLERECAGYRILGGNIVQINSKEEIEAIEKAIFSPVSDPVKTHLKTALAFLSNRENPDYRNSIKESISAVESYCVSLVGEGKDTLGKALKLLEEKHGLHKALRSAFSNLYGYTSDAGGIRHHLLDGDKPATMEDAKFMLVSCSAFINFLKSTLKN